MLQFCEDFDFGVKMLEAGSWKLLAVKSITSYCKIKVL